MKKGKYLSKRILERRKRFSFDFKSFRKLFIFSMKTFSLNSKQLFFSQLLFTKEGRVSALPFFVHPPQNINQPSDLRLRSHFSKRKKKKGEKRKCCEALLSSCSCCCGEEGRAILLSPPVGDEREVICNELVRAKG